MIFAPDLAAAITLGTKTVTRRPRLSDKPCRYQVGRSYAMQLARGGFALERLIIESVTEGLVGDVDDLEAALEGFPSARAFRRRWTELYGRFDPEMPVWRIEFVVDPDWPAHPVPKPGQPKEASVI